MKKSYLFFTVILFFLSIAGTSCKDEDDKKQEGERPGIALDSISAIACTDLAGREGWSLKVENSYDYSCTVKGRQIEASPDTIPYRFNNLFGKGDKLSPASVVRIYFMSPEYYGIPDNKSTGSIQPYVQDQSTPEKLLTADMLWCQYTGNVDEHITGVQLVHANMLVEFELKNISNLQNISVVNVFSMIPCRDAANPDLYRAIVPAIGTEAGIILKINGIYYGAGLPDITPDTHYKLTLRLDTEQNKLLLENLEKRQWSAEQ